MNQLISGNNIAIVALLALSFVSLTSCSEKIDGICSDDISASVAIAVSASEYRGAKSLITDLGSKSTFAWSDEDNLGLYISDIQNNVLLTCMDKSNGLFKGNLERKHKTSEDVPFCAYYPYSTLGGVDCTCLNGTLPSIQDATNPMACDYMVATPIIADYDESNLPSLNFQFCTHLFAIVKVSFTVSTHDLNGESLLSLGLKSETQQLSGDFTFNVTDTSALAVMLPDSFNASKQVVSVFDEGHRQFITKGGTYSTYLIVKPGTYPSGDISLVVNTTNYKFTLATNNELNLQRTKVNTLSTADLSGSAVHRETINKTVVLWGDSITAPGSFSSTLQSLLGKDWKVYNGGVPSDPAYVVAGRQGGLPLYTGTEFVLKKSANDTTQNDGLWVVYSRNAKERNEQLLYSRSQEYKNSTALINPVTLVGYYTDGNGVEQSEEVECVVDYERTDGWSYFPSSKGIRSIHRASNGEYDLTIKAGTPVHTYASRVYRDAGVIVVYVGTNGHTSSTEYYNHLINTQDKMLDFQRRSNPNALIIVCGYHMGSNMGYWSQTYVNMMSSHFGKFFIDQRSEGANNAIRYMLELGMISSVSDVSKEDMTLIENNNWPSCFGSISDVHPNNNGYKVRALLVRDKMKELGLIE